MLSQRVIETAVAAALAEDAPWGDVTAEALIPLGAEVTAELVARQAGVFSGSGVFEAAMRLTDAGVRTVVLRADGERFSAGDVLARVTGPARSVLTAERVGLNFVQRMSGIATMTDRFVTEVAGTGVRIVDTRKTTPGLRALERHAVVSGGGHNHRWGLSDAVMAKDNHLATLAVHGISVTEGLLMMRQKLGHTTHIEVEVDRLDQIEAVLAAGVDTVMLDNFSIEDLRRGVALINGRALVEASGNVSLATVRAIAQTGVDVISVGALTHSVASIDLGLDIRAG
jgi:nicotinate-nucleotide pyrophosphorylase (carboxylating)